MKKASCKLGGRPSLAHIIYPIPHVLGVFATKKNCISCYVNSPSNRFRWDVFNLTVPYYARRVFFHYLFLGHAEINNNIIQIERLEIVQPVDECDAGRTFLLINVL